MNRLAMLVAFGLWPVLTLAFQSTPNFPGSPGTIPYPTRLSAAKKKAPNFDSGEEPTCNISLLQKHFNLPSKPKVKDAWKGTVMDMDRSELIRRVDTVREKLELNREELGKMLQRGLSWLRFRPERTFKTIEFFQDKIGCESTKKLILRNPSVMHSAVKDGQQLQRNLHWIEEQLKVSDAPQLAKLLLGAPSLAYQSVDNNLQPSFAKLQKSLNLREDETVKLIVKNPSILILDLEKNLEPKINWIKDLFDGDETKMKKACMRQPLVLNLDFQNNLMPKVVWLGDELGMSKQQIAKVFSCAPVMFMCDFENNIKPKIMYLMDELGCEKRQVVKMLCKSPAVFTLDFKNNVKPKIAWMKETFDLDNAELAKCLAKAPRILAYSSSNEKCTSVIHWTQERLLLDKQGVKSIFIKKPDLFYTAKQFDEYLEWFESELGLSSKDDIRKMVSRMPSLLSLKIESNLQPTWDFFKMVLGSNEALDFIINNPAGLSSSLKNRLLPRLEEAQEAGMEINRPLVHCMVFDKPENWELRIRRLI